MKTRTHLNTINAELTEKAVSWFNYDVYWLTGLGSDGVWSRKRPPAAISMPKQQCLDFIDITQTNTISIELMNNVTKAFNQQWAFTRSPQNILGPKVSAMERDCQSTSLVGEYRSSTIPSPTMRKYYWTPDHHVLFDGLSIDEYNNNKSWY